MSYWSGYVCILYWLTNNTIIQRKIQYKGSFQADLIYLRNLETPQVYCIKLCCPFSLSRLSMLCFCLIDDRLLCVLLESSTTATSEARTHIHSLWPQYRLFILQCYHVYTGYCNPPAMQLTALSQPAFTLRLLNGNINIPTEQGAA